MYTYIRLFSCILILSYLINYIFLLNRTSFLLISSIFIFLSCSIIFFILELEFLAIAFSIVYVGGIAIMFLFLILTVDVRIENAEGRLLVPDIRISILIASFIFYFLWLLLSSYDPAIFNTFNTVDIVVFDA